MEVLVVVVVDAGEQAAVIYTLIQTAKLNDVASQPCPCTISGPWGGK
jgi:hypothetical protein